MKRSEVIKLMQQVYFDYGLGYDDVLEDHTASAILDKLEEVGMLPPETLIETDNPLVPGDFNIKGKWYTPGKFVWEDEAKPSISDIIKQVLEDNKEVLEKLDE